ncbi:MAG TPA: hypothetical protein VLB51_14505 [Methylomirabilota bacterium]|nr:hypothetical protein [Methylomirabilota bacterium]
MTHPWQRCAAAASLALVALFAAGCEPKGPTAEQRSEIESAVRDYLHALARSYSTLDLSHMEGHASPVEVRNVRNLLQQLANTGDRIEATLVGFEVTGLDVFREVNASVSLVEVWDIVRYNALTGEEKGSRLGSVQTTLIQLRTVDGEWLVIGRHIVERDQPPPTEPVDEGPSPATAQDGDQP